jgi:hypothetical protein
MLGALHQSIEAVQDSEAYAIGQQYRTMASSLEDPELNPFWNLSAQLFAGANTAAHTMFTEVRSVPSIIEEHDPEGALKGQSETIARRSVNLSARLAMTSVNQMMAAREALLWNGPWITTGIRLINPDTCLLSPTNDGGAVVTYADFWGMKAPAPGHAPNADRLLPLEEDTPIGDVASVHSKTIGCPLTLIPGYLKMLRNRYIDSVVENGGLRH